MDVDPLLKVRNWGTSVWEQLCLFWIQNTLLKPKQQKWHDLQNFISDFSSLIVLTWWGCGTPGAADTYWQAKQSDFGSCGSNNSHVQVVEARPWRMTLMTLIAHAGKSSVFPACAIQPGAGRLRISWIKCGRFLTSFMSRFWI